LCEAAVAFVQAPVKQYRLDWKRVVMPQRQAVEGMPVPRRVRQLHVLRLAAIDDSGRGLPRQPVRALDAATFRGVHEHLDVVGEQEVIVIEKVEPLTARFGERDIAGARAADSFARGAVTQLHSVEEALDDALRGRGAV